MIKKSLLFVAAVFSVLCISAADQAKVQAVAVKDSEIKLDGVLDEAVWKKATQYGNFTKWKYPETQAMEPTAFKVAAS